MINSGNGLAANALSVSIASDSTGQVKLAAGTAAVGTVALAGGSTAATDLLKLEDQASASGDALVPSGAIRQATPANSSGADGDYENLKVSGGKLWTHAGGSVAHDSAVGSVDNPILLGAEAFESDGSSPGSVAQNNVSRLKCDRDGRLFVNTGHPFAWSATSNLSTAATTVLKVAPGAGLSLYITSVSVSSLTAQSTKLTEDSAGTPVDKVELLYTGASTTTSLQFPNPIRLTSDVNLAYITSAAVATSITVTGFTAP